jgi:cobalt/nickel transport protein
MRRNLILLALAAAIVVLPLLIAGDAAFTGADGQARDLIDAAGYQPWFTPFWKPPSGEVEGLLFALQAALGAGLLGYYIGLRRGRHERGTEHRAHRDGVHAGD